MDYSRRLSDQYTRQNPERFSVVEQRMFADDRVGDKDVEKYVRRSMMAVDPAYTQKTILAGEMVKDHLRQVLTNVSFEYQGSVMTDTHIKGASDIDLLVLCDKFYGTEIDRVRQEISSYEKYSYQELARLNEYNRSFNLYQGSGNEDLKQLRQQIEQSMSNIYSICDTSKAKAVSITNQNLHRDVDIVTSSWFQSLDYVLNGMPKNMLGIKIFNKELGYAEGPDYPFLSIYRINERSTKTNGRLKRMIRFLKNVRTDSDKEIDLTSFEINAICYSIPVDYYQYSTYQELVRVLSCYMGDLSQNNRLDALESVVGGEYVFRGKPDKVEAFNLLIGEVNKIYNDLFN